MRDPTFGPNRSKDLSSGLNVCASVYEMPLGRMPLDGMPLHGAAVRCDGWWRRAGGARAARRREWERGWERVNACFLCDIQVT